MPSAARDQVLFDHCALDLAMFARMAAAHALRMAPEIDSTGRQTPVGRVTVDRSYFDLYSGGGGMLTTSGGHASKPGSRMPYRRLATAVLADWLEVEHTLRLVAGGHARGRPAPGRGRRAAGRVRATRRGGAALQAPCAATVPGLRRGHGGGRRTRGAARTRDRLRGVVGPAAAPGRCPLDLPPGGVKAGSSSCARPRASTGECRG